MVYSQRYVYIKNVFYEAENIVPFSILSVYVTKNETNTRAVHGTIQRLQQFQEWWSMDPFLIEWNKNPKEENQFLYINYSSKSKECKHLENPK
jgi:hypothetical protein